MCDSLGIGPAKTVVSYVGQIRDIKGTADFIELAHRIQDPEVHFLIAGECRDPSKRPGSYSESNLHEMIGSDRRIQYIGYVDRVEDVYQSSDVVVVPSRWEQPLGLIAIEAGACKKPVIGTRVGGIPEVVVEGLTGYLCEPGDVGCMATRLNRLLADVNLRNAFGDGAFQHVSSQFAEKPVREFERVLLRLTAK